MGKREGGWLGRERRLTIGWTEGHSSFIDNKDGQRKRLRERERDIGSNPRSKRQLKLLCGFRKPSDYFCFFKGCQKDSGSKFVFIRKTQPRTIFPS